MNEYFFSKRFEKKVWLTNHAIESMNKRGVTLFEVKTLFEKGLYKETETEHGWIHYQFNYRDDNLVCAAITNKDAIIIKTIMINWNLR
ncbi:MAG: DUF4258 domain-containing protein [Gammaproteobacteria bacterium]|nr:DUF4258 domain-containing protein [Gammaproteobacteria bacterium]